MPAKVTSIDPGSLRLQDHIAASLVRAFVMIVRDELRHRLPEVPLSEQEDAIETLLLNRSNKPLRMGVRIRCPMWSLDDLQARVRQEASHR